MYISNPGHAIVIISDDDCECNMYVVLYNGIIDQSVWDTRIIYAQNCTYSKSYHLCISLIKYKLVLNGYENMVSKVCATQKHTVTNYIAIYLRITL